MCARLSTPSPTTVAEAAELLAAGQLVAFPTETVYGLGANACDDRAVARLFEAKGRPHFNPLIAHVADRSGVDAIAMTDARVDLLADLFWPGPLTLVLPRRPDAGISLLATAGLDTVAVRVPGHQTAREIIAAAGVPIAAPSANRSGRVSPTTPQHVAADLGDWVSLIVAGGRCRHGIESTVVDLTGPDARLLRPGAVSRDMLVTAIGPLADAAPADRPSAPGGLASHYAPLAAVRLNAGACSVG